jgi:DNA polymerase-3 subunit alpha
VWLTNPQSKSTYNVYVTDGCHPQNGMYYLMMDEALHPAFGLHGSTWVVFLNAATSEVTYVEGDAFRKIVQACMSDPGAYGGNISLAKNSNWYALWFRPDAGVFPRTPKSKIKGTYKAFRSFELAGKEDFVHLHVHSTYSLLDGVSSVEKLPVRAKENGQPGIALTDHGYMFGAFKFFNACKEAEVKPIIGVEAYMVDDAKGRYVDVRGVTRRFEYHQTILAMNQVGWENLNALCSEACRDNFYHVPRIDQKSLFARGEGLIVLSGCFKGKVSWHLQPHVFEGSADMPWCVTDPDISRQTMREFKAHFGDRYFIEVQPIDYADYMAIVPGLVQMAREEGIQCVVTGDSHYETAEDAILQAITSRIGGFGSGDSIGQSMAQQGCYYIRPMAEMQYPVFTPDMFTNTVEIMNRCDVDLSFKGFMFPDYPIENDVDYQAYVAEAAKAQS